MVEILSNVENILGGEIENTFIYKTRTDLQKIVSDLQKVEIHFLSEKTKTTFSSNYNNICLFLLLFLQLN